MSVARAMKDSGTQWLGAVPASWGVQRLGTVFDLQRRPVRSTDGTVTAYRNGQVTLRTKRRADGYTEADKEIGYQGVREGDLVIHAMDAFAGAIGVSDSEGKSTPVYAISTPRGAHCAHYFAPVLRHIAISGYITSLGRGVRERSTDFRWRDAAQVLVPVPPAEEQRQIVTYLDRETGRIDELIAKQEQLLITLAERRRAVILRAVNPPSQDGWLRSPLKRFVRSHDRRRIPLSTEERSTRKGNYPYYGASGIIDHVDDYLFNEPMVLVSEDGANLLNRNSPIAFEALGEYWVNNHAHILEPLDGRTAFWAQRIESEDLRTGVTGSAQPKLTADALMNWPVSAPALIDERIAIERNIRDSTVPIDALSTKATQMIALLRERRQALTSAAVTGKIDVRST